MRSIILAFLALLIQEVFSDFLKPGALHRSKKQFSINFSNPSFICEGNANCGNNVINHGGSNSNAEAGKNFDTVWPRSVFETLNSYNPETTYVFLVHVHLSHAYILAA